MSESRDSNLSSLEGLVGDRRGEQPTLREILTSVGLWGAGLSWLLPGTTAMIAAYSALGSHRVDPATRFFLRMQTRLLGVKWRAEVHPAVDANTQYIFAQNHINHFDFMSMYRATPHYKQGLELETHFKYPFYGWFMKSRGTVPVPADRSGRTEMIYQGMKSELEAGRSMLVFPEGTRTLNGRVGAFRRGIFVIAQRLGVPIVPTAVTGMYDVMRKGSLLLRPGMEVKVYIDEPVQTEGTTEADLPDIIKLVHDRIAARVDAYMDAREATHGRVGQS